MSISKLIACKCYFYARLFQINSIQVKKLVTIFSLLIYANIAFGITIDYHYCNKSLAGVSLLNFGGHSGCDCDSKGVCKGCCKDKVRSLKADNHQATHSFTIANFSSFYIEPNAEKSQSAGPVFYNNSTCIIGSLKRCCPVPIYLLDNVFRI